MKHVFMQIRCLCNFATFVRIFMKFSLNHRAKKLGVLFTIFGKFLLIFGLNRGDIQPQKA